ncbi:late competence protein ComER [Pontibacillus litoralis]|uniref:Competence protein ComER n=1 Tax=Pontibacillus litoralis JSM 072002 TaxID=1385512 RepID=A0A0A5GA69_9BACI|nr:late competence protein ComER [Pontibacillus litoralis]KGX88939.1 competence protein ComER [Pontibacillus litoralis JSM 072002]
MKWGVIGIGNMGEMLVQAWLESRMVEPQNVVLHNRSIYKAEQIQQIYPSVTVVSDPISAAKQVDILFVCVKPLSIHPLLGDIREHLTEEQCLVSITSPYSVKELEQLVPCQVARIIPSITNRAVTGASLVTFGERIKPIMKSYLEQSIKHYSKPIEIKEDITRVSSDIVSCGPAFFSYIMQRFIEATCEETNITKKEATMMMSEMMIGLGKLIEDGHYSLETLQQKVCVKGGVTGEGIKVLEEEIGNMFHRLLQKTHEKYAEDKREIAEQLEV